MATQLLFAPQALLPDGWAENVLLTVDGGGTLTAVARDVEAERSAGAERLRGPVLPGLPNLHSHAFQRAMAGLAERAGPGEDSFWTWRKAMYGLAATLTPEALEAIAAQLYVELLKQGYTAVGEFHYLHHAPDGEPYPDLALLSRALLAAAGESGIGITLLPVLYGYGGFGGKPAGEGQRRFLNDPPRFLRLVETLLGATRDDPQVRIGIAPHSLRAVTPETLRETLAGFAELDGGGPIHIHVAEQVGEVEQSLEWCNRRPVEWLLEEIGVDERWCLVHATHMSERETQAVAASKAVAGLCPTTEANLGDGFFPAREYLVAGGRFGIGSDSHISVSPREELRWLEYGQRLLHRRRNLLADKPGGSVGARLYTAALAGGAQALGRPIAGLGAGNRADLLVLDPAAPTLLGRGGDTLLDAFIFAGNDNPIADVMAGGRWLVRDGRHVNETAILDRYRKTLTTLAA